MSDSATPWTVAYHAPPSIGFSRQEYWSGLPFPFPEDLPNPGIKPGSPALESDALPSESPAKSQQQTKQKYKPTHQQTRYHLTQPCASEENQTNKNSAKISPYMKLTQTTGPTLGGQKPKERKNLTLKPGKRRLQTQYV